MPWRSLAAVRSRVGGTYGWRVLAKDGRSYRLFTWRPRAFAEAVLSYAPHADLDPYLRDLARPAAPYRLDSRSRLLVIIVLLGPLVIIATAAALAHR